MWRRHVLRGLQRLGYALCVFVFYLLVARALSWAGREPGWPENHEKLSMFLRVEAFRRAFAVGDWLPIWSPYCFNGHGSPGPLVYHRLFNILAGFLALKSGAIAATRTTITVLIAVGSLGMHRAAKQLGVGPWFRIAAGVLFAASPYLLTDWLVRCAAAEFAAMALVPWFIAAAIRFSRGERVGFELGLIAGLLFHAHSMICFFALAIPIIAAVVSIAAVDRGRRWDAWSGALSTALRFTIVFVLIVGPFLLTIYLLKTRESMQKLDVFDPSRGGFVPIGRYIADPFDWGAQWQGLSVELGRAVALLFVATWFAAGFTRTRVLSAGVWMLLVMTGLFGFMQHPASAVIYRTLPGAALLQFPWRLLVFLVPGVILLTCAAGQALIAAHRRAIPLVASAFVVVVGWQLLFCLESQKLTYERTSEAELEKAVESLDGPNNEEYLPHFVASAPSVSPFITLRGCRALTPLPADTPHLGKFGLWVAPGPKCVVEFNQFCTPLLMVVSSRGTVSCTPRGTIALNVDEGPPAFLRLQRRSFVSAIRELMRSRREGGG